MKHIVLFLFCLVLNNSMAKPRVLAPASLNEMSGLIVKCFERGDAELLESLLSKEIELIIDSENVEFAKVSKERAKFILSSFFKQNPPIEFSYVYEGSSSESLRYSVGNYKSNNNEFLIYLLVKENADHSYGIKTLQLRKN